MRYSQYNFAENSKIYWEKDNNFFEIPKANLKKEYDLIIIGSGYTGLSTAFHLDKNKSVLIVDKSSIGYGGSSRNGGFCCLGGTKLSYKEIEKTYGCNNLIEFFNIQKNAIDLVKDILDEPLSAEDIGEILYYYNESELLEDAQEYEQYKNKLNLEFEVFSKNQLLQNQLELSGVKGALKVNYGFGINPKSLVFKLVKKILINQNVDFSENTEVNSIQKNNNGFEIVINNQKLKTKKCLLATNGYLNNKRLLFSVYSNLVPALSNILVTEPIDNNKFSNWKTLIPCADSIPLLHYFRLLKDNRIMFGGRGGHSYNDTQTYKKILLNDFNKLFPEFKSVGVEYFWRGLVGVTKEKIAHIGSDNGVYYGYGYNGNGVSLATYFGKLLAQILDEKININSLPNCIIDNPKAMIFPVLKIFYLFLAYQYYKLNS